MRVRAALAALLVLGACAQVKPAEEFAYQTEAERSDAVPADAADVADVLADDAADVAGVDVAPDAQDAADVADAGDAVDVLDSADVKDVADVLDSADNSDAPDVADTPDAADAQDVTATADAVDASDVSDPCPTLNCDDGDPCSDDACTPFVGCKHTPGSGSACAPDPCHKDGTCDGGVCKFAVEISCDDANDCTVDSCATASGCGHVALNNGSCLGDLCFISQTCKGGACQGGSPATCDDGNVCTDDSCDAKAGCVHLPNTATCDDGDACTTADVCAGAKCAGVGKFVDKGYPAISGGPASVLALSDGYGVFSDGGNAPDTLVFTRTGWGGEVIWQSNYGGPASVQSWAKDAAPLADGFLLLSLGQTMFGTAADLRRIDATGKVTWSQAYGGVGTAKVGNALALDPTGIAVAGAADDTNGAAVGWLQHVDLSGGATWTMTYGGPANDQFYAVAPTADGFALAGATNNGTAGFDDFWLVRTDANGAKLWEKRYGGTGTDEAWSVLALADGFLLAGSTDSKGAGGVDAWLVRTDLNGNKLWDKTYGGKQPDGALQVIAVPGGYAFSGTTASTGAGGNEMWLVRTDALGNKMFGFPYGGAQDDGGAHLALLPDGFALAGTTNSKGPGLKVWLLRTDLFGNTTCATSGSCLGKTFADCSDGNPCTADLCDASHSGCFHGAPAAFACDDGQKCTGPDACTANVCGGPAINCDDKNACTADSCDPEFGCVNDALNGGACGGDKCTGMGVCGAGACLGGAPIACDDSNPCTGDGCDLALGCTHTNLSGGPCDDTQICTLNDQCTAGNCSGSPVNCNDGNVCTDDSCNPSFGCVHPNNGAACNSDGCLQGQHCSDGICGGGTAKNCDDSNSCTTDFCAFGNCAHGFLPNAATCTTGTDCVVGETCTGGVCGSGGPKDCNDNNPCTVDSCSAGICQNSPVPVGTECTNHGFCDASPACVGQMASIPSGTFWMGCNSVLDSNCSADESPQHKVTLSAYAMDLTETTVAQYKACVDAGVCTVPSAIQPMQHATYPGLLINPVNFLSWTQAQQYCQWRGAQFDLPTEAQWEMAARGSCGNNASTASDPACASAMRTYPWGEAVATCSEAVMNDSGTDGCGTDATWAVASKLAGDSPYGIHDLAGNLHEWTRDWYSASYFASSPGSDPVNGTSGTARVFRGGSWDSTAIALHTSRRFSWPPANAAYDVGLRCARSLP